MRDEAKLLIRDRIIQDRINKNGAMLARLREEVQALRLRGLSVRRLEQIASDWTANLERQRRILDKIG